MTIDQSLDVTMESDPNNNNENSSNNNLSIKKNEKYSLRQRGQRKSITSKHSKSSATAKSNDAEKNSNCNINQNHSNNCDEFNSAALSAAVTKSLTTTTKEKTPKEKPKQKAAPLSKYRRKTANARERTRMREINHAFENLRQSVPVVVAGSPAQNTNEKLTKITTLRMAMKYITILSDILDNKAELNDSLLTSLMEVDSKHVRKENNNISNNNSKNSKEKQQPQLSSVLAQNHHDYCKEFIRETLHVKPVKSSRVVAAAAANSSNRKAVKANATKTKKPPSKSHSKSQKINVGNLKSKQVTAAVIAASNPSIISMRNQSIGIHSNITNSINNNGNSNSNSSSESKFINHLLGGNFNHASNTMTMLNGSGINNNNLNCLSKYDLSLSPCLTPPNDEPSELGLILESDGESLQLSEPCFSPLEFGLLLESDGESLHLSEPCLSPLSHLDAFNSINDLLHGSFSEHNSLEMYLS
ncbi:hypothetical protein PVAND_009694 [Polypedilum vanderplanki]|uniref:BHLH domain-containing protein n=1 Tax=Polypedilum vanderplanki TaxID=319348 RepID=A0A9J6CDA9_POLVA|nr:hypothetical protein PVAND_009694 [Polypedilum vanderplanki]